MIVRSAILYIWLQVQSFAGMCRWGGAFIGAGAIVIPGKKIGAWSIVGAGAVVINDIPDGVVVVGNPARIIRSLSSKFEV